MSRIYISGQIGEDSPSEATVSRFRAGVMHCQRLGYETFNPCSEAWQHELRRGYERDREMNQGHLTRPFPPFYDYCLLRDMMVIATCEAIYMMRGWRRSPGARAEHEYAKATGIKILYQKEL